MQNIYLLLRNNKQSGPHSLEELLQLNLKPYDLVWVEGKSAGWSYPYEVSSLKPYLTPEPAMDQNAIHENENVDPKKIVSREVKPLKKIYVSLPSNANITSTVAVSLENNNEEPSESFEERVEKMRLKALNFSKEEKKADADELDTKYSRSLEDIKEEYSHWLYKQKTKKNFRLSKQHLGIAAVLLVIIISGFAVKNFVLAGETPEQIVSNKKMEEMPTSVENNTANNVNNSVSQKLDEDLKKLSTDKPVFTKRKEVKKPTPKKKGEETTAKDVPFEEPILTEQDDAVQTTVYRTNKTSVPLARQVEIKAKYLEAKKGIWSLQVTLYNNSNQLLKVVAVDVYYKKAENILETKTLYFSNIAPNSSMVLSAPSNKNAESAYAQMGLISSEKSIYYAKQ